MKDQCWYIARLRPGASRVAPDRIITRGPGAGELLHPERKGETFIERSLRDAGFDCYFPRMRKEVMSRRRRQVTVKSYPLFTGYAFVNGLQSGSVSASKCDGVAEILGLKMDGRPWPVADEVVSSFRTAEAALEFDDTHEARVKRKQEGRTRRETVKMMFPEGAEVRVKGNQLNHHHPLAGFHGQVVSVTGKGMVRVMMNLFAGAVPVEMGAADLEAA